MADAAVDEMSNEGNSLTTVSKPTETETMKDAHLPTMSQLAPRVVGPVEGEATQGEIQTEQGEEEPLVIEAAVAAEDRDAHAEDVEVATAGEGEGDTTTLPVAATPALTTAR